ncbi:MAG: subfamily polymerase sigma-24 subunit [Paenibacillaceae bacterium]|jgi:RNA polymerase sigma-70 factor (ECF subfamily)|nr:subfamily polymerase sigma-24 subunit [Paenibacillaceae bacterium]
MTQPQTMPLALAEEKRDTADRLQSGPPQAAFGAVFELYYDRVFRYIRYRVECQYTAEDLTSQVFERVLGRFASFREEKAPFEVWLFAIARNAVNDYGRQQKRRRFFSLEALKEAASGGKTPEAMALAGEAKDSLLQAMCVLKPKERSILALKFGAELKNGEIARLTGMSESNVGVTLYRSMKKLRTELERKGCHE